MIRVDSPIIGRIIVAPVIAGAFLSGIFYLAEGAAIPLTLFQLALMSAFLLFFLRQLVLKESTINVYGLEKHYLIFLMIILFSLIYSPDREEGLFMVLRVVVLFSMTYLLYNLIDDLKSLKLVCYIILGSGLFIAILSIVEFYFNPQIAAFNYANQGQKLLRTEGVETDPNIFASNLMLPIMLISAHFSYSKTISQRVIKFGIIGVLLAAVLITYSRSSWVSIAIGMFFLMGVQRKFTLLFYLFAAFIVLFSVSESIQTLTMSVLERFVNIFAGETDDSSKFRILLAKTAMLMILDSYLFGIGYQGFSTEFKKYHPPQETQGIYEPHNEFYTVFAELGLIGFIVFIVILGQVFKRALSAIKLVKGDPELKWIVEGVTASFLSYMLFFQFLSGMLLHSILIINVSLIFCAYNIAKSRNSSIIE